MVGSGFFYRWQVTTFNANTAIQERDHSITTLSHQVQTLSAQQTQDQADLAAQKKRLADATLKLKAVQDQLAKISSELTQKESDLAKAQQQLAQQESQLSQNADELQKLRARPPLFSFQNQSNISNYDEKQAEIKTLVTDAYDYITKPYGQPYLLNQITITFVNNFSITGSAGEIVIENSSKGISINIHMKDFDKNSFQDTNTLIHEIVHGFHGLAVLGTSAFEEGMTVATADAVMEEMIADGKIPHFSSLYVTVTPEQYDTWNRTLSLSADNVKFYQSADISKIYQLVGRAWLNLYRQDTRFFDKLNQSYYTNVQHGEEPTNDLIMGKIKTIIPRVDGVDINTYLQQNRAFHPK